MHVLIPHALSDDPAARAALQRAARGGLQLSQLPHLQTLLRQLAGQDVLHVSDHSVSSAAEQIRACAQGLAAQAAAWAALRAHELGLPQAASQPWGFVTPSHWEIGELGQTQASLRDPQELALQEDEARALLAAMAPFFAEDGLSLYYDTPLRWLVSGQPLAGLVCPSPERVLGHDLAPWLPASALLRRLQNEMQMLLYTHPVNEARAARRALPVNSFWLSATGALAAPPRPVQELHILHALERPAQQGDWDAWVRAWQQLDAQLAPLQAALQSPADFSLTLCSAQLARRYTRQPQGWGAWRSRWWPSRKQQKLSEILIAA